MKKIHIEARSEADIMPAMREAFRHLKEGGNAALMSTIQHLHKLEEARRFLEENKISAVVSGQVLGCRVPPVPDNTDKIIYVGSGRFHPLGVMMKTGIEVIAANPFTGKAVKMTKKDAEAIEKRKKAALSRFLSSDNIGILISVKKGQARVQGGTERIKEVRKKYSDKNFYLFAFNTLQEGYLDNFPFVECWVNTACPRIFEDFRKSMINIEDIR